MSNLFGNDYDGRKAIPIFEGVVMYFPKALAAVSEVSHAGNQQHTPGEPLHWARGKSMDQYNTALRHMMDHRMGGGRVNPQQEGQEINNGWIKETRDKDGVRHLAKAAWRVLAALELAIEEEEAAPQPGPSPESSEPVPSLSPLKSDDIVASQCACGARSFFYHRGDLPPNVVSDGHTHTENGCV